MTRFGLIRYLAERDGRGPAAGLRLFLACLMLGTGVMAALGSIEAAFVRGLEQRGQTILGGDVQLRLTQREADAAQLAFLRAQGTLSASSELRAMAQMEETAALVEIKAVDQAWPLYGEAEFAPPMELRAVLAERDGVFGAAVDGDVLTRLNARLGDRVQLGAARVELRARLAYEPDRLSGGFTWAPRLLLSADALAASELTQPGSLYYHFYRLRLDDATAPGLEALRSRLYERFPEAGWRVRDHRNASPSFVRALDRLSGFLGLIGLTVLLIAAIGIGSAMLGYMQSRQEQIAIFKAMGADAPLLRSLYLWQTMRFVGLAVLVGLLWGGALPVALLWLFADRLPLPITLGLYWQPLLQAALFGALAAYAFLLPVLGRALKARPALLFRGPLFAAGLAGGGLPSPPRTYQLAALACLAALVAIALWSVERFVWGLGFFAVLAVAYGLFSVLARALVWLAPLRPASWPLALRMALANIARPSASVRSFLLSFGIAAALLVAVGLAEANVSKNMRAEIPDIAPAFFFMDVPSQRIEEFVGRVSAHQGFEGLERQPILRGRLTSLGGVAVADLTPPPDGAWLIRGDRVIAYATEKPEEAELVEGAWWAADYDGPPLVSFAEEEAREYGLAVGDRITINVLGREVDAEIANLRRVDWSQMTMDFVMIFSPNPLRNAPHSFMLTVQIAPQDEASLLRMVLGAFPAVTVIRVKDVITRIGGLMQQLVLAIRVLALVTFLAGLFVLAGALASAHRARLYDAVVSKLVGGTRRQLMGVHVLEYGLLGMCAMVLAAGVGIALSWGLSAWVLQLDWEFFALPLWGAVLLIGGGSLLLGSLGAARALGARPARMLRQL